MFSPKDLDLPPARAHAFDETVHFVWLAARLADFRHYDIRIEPPIHPRRELEMTVLIGHRLDPDEHVLFGVVEPMTSAPRTNDTLKLDKW